MTRVRRVLPPTLWALTVAFALAGLVLTLVNRTPTEGTVGGTTGDAVFVLPILTFASIGALIAARQPWNSIGWIFAGTGLSFAVGNFALQYAVRALVADPGSLPGGVWMLWLSDWLTGLAVFLGGVLLFLLFPDGKLLSRRWRWVLWTSVTAAALLAVAVALKAGSFDQEPFTSFENPAGVQGTGDALEAVSALFWLATMVSYLAAGLCLALRFRRAGATQREQIKWVTAAALFFVAALVASNLAYDEGKLVEGVTAVISLLAFMAIPLATGVAILKYHLWDIDVLVRKTVVYGGVSALLAGVYFGIVIGLQAAFGGLTRGNDLAIAGSTLAVAALFRPARARIQAFVDRRFYRRRYDAERTLRAFSARLRDELDLDALASELGRVAREPMQPAHASVWLRQRSTGR